MKCTPCLSGFTWECKEKGNCDNGNSLGSVGSDVSADVHIGSLSGVIVGDPEDTSADPNRAEEESSRIGDGGDDREDVIVTYKDDSALRDQQSTGRKRAAKAYPLNPDAPCEWKMRKNCGGGDSPIVGCVNGTQQARHHGPDKNTLNNEKGNVHRICHTCHNRWHTLNDENYVWGAVYPLHESYEASIADIGLNELFWENRKVVKAKD